MPKYLLSLQMSSIFLLTPLPRSFFFFFFNIGLVISLSGFFPFLEERGGGGRKKKKKKKRRKSLLRILHPSPRGGGTWEAPSRQDDSGLWNNWASVRG